MLNGPKVANIIVLFRYCGSLFKQGCTYFVLNTFKACQRARPGAWFSKWSASFWDERFSSQWLYELDHVMTMDRFFLSDCVDIFYGYVFGSQCPKCKKNVTLLVVVVTYLARWNIICTLYNCFSRYVFLGFENFL